mmetsp:Transcript_98495/g.155685  ORF Transcript_98495/g.155685 Transcript_98495/m.155685 type:complete len:262 (-) Transcript_98495:99-884(-)
MSNLGVLRQEQGNTKKAMELCEETRSLGDANAMSSPCSLGEDLIAIRSRLQTKQEKDEHASPNLPALADESELDPQVQIAIQESIGDIATMQLFAAGVANSQVSQTLHQRRIDAEAGKYVVHLRFSRPCKALRDLLLESEELAPCRQSLQDAGFGVELDSGLKIFVSPDHYKAVMAAVQDRKFFPKDVIVDPALEKQVLQLVSGMKKKDHVKPRASRPIPLGFFLEAEKEDLQVSWSRHFISIKVPSSLCSSSAAQAPKTV